MHPIELEAGGRWPYYARFLPIDRTGHKKLARILRQKLRTEEEARGPRWRDALYAFGLAGRPPTVGAECPSIWARKNLATLLRRIEKRFPVNSLM